MSEYKLPPATYLHAPFSAFDGREIAAPPLNT
jgi:hypothetical protein